MSSSFASSFASSSDTSLEPGVPAPLTPAPLTPAPLTPAPLTPAQQRAERTRHRDAVRSAQERGLVPRQSAMQRVWGAPAGKQCTLEEVTVRRVPVTVTPAAHALILASTSEGRIFPQALSEHFGANGNVRQVIVDAVRKDAHFRVGPEECHPITREPGGAMLLTVTIKHAGHPNVEPHTLYMNASDLCDLHPITHLPLFRAALTAREHYRLWPHKHVPVPATPEPVEPTPEPAKKRTRTQKRG
ncbi:MAG: hypothetical protein IVW57_00160 [Ktedonobacterales bacterium]|nr:hypothetical protein [Ktedonobacterales bacterium]